MTFYLLLLAYLVVSFALGAVWHMVLFKEYYKKLAIYSRIENPRFTFGLSSMFLQSIVLAYLYPVIGNAYVFGIGLFMTLASFLVFAEAGKQNTNSLSGFVGIQIAYCAVQTLLVTFSFAAVSLI
jgi:hypothetical protein